MLFASQVPTRKTIEGCSIGVGHQFVGEEDSQHLQWLDLLDVYWRLAVVSKNDPYKMTLLEPRRQEASALGCETLYHGNEDGGGNSHL